MNNSKFYLLVAGSRTFADYDFMVSKLDAFLSRQIVDHRSICIVSGGARGADKLAERYANERGFELRVFPANWDRFGKSAGYRRNEQMHKFIAQFEHRGCVCFWDGESRGTTHNFKLAEQFKTPLRIVHTELMKTIIKVTYSEADAEKNLTFIKEEQLTNEEVENF